MNLILVLLAALAVAGATNRGAVLSGSVVGPDGRSVAGALVDVWTAAPKVGRGLICPSCYADCKKSVETSADGRFEIAGLNPSLRFRLLVASAGHESQFTKLLDPAAGPVNIKLRTATADDGRHRAIRGRVVDAKGRPIPGVLVEPIGAKTAEKRWHGRVDLRPVLTGVDGHFLLPVSKEMLAVDLDVTAAAFSGIRVPLVEPGPEMRAITLPHGVRLVGSLVAGDRPVQGAQLAALPIDTPGDRDPMNRYFGGPVASTTDEQGRFEMPSLQPGRRYELYAEIDLKGRRPTMTSKRLTMGEDESVRDVGALQAVEGLRLSGRVKLPGDAPLPKGSRLTLSRNTGWGIRFIRLSADGRFDLRGLPPEVYKLQFAVKGYTIDTHVLPFQMVGSEEFGIRLDASQSDLVVQMKPVKEDSAKELPHGSLGHSEAVAQQVKNRAFAPLIPGHPTRER